MGWLLMLLTVPLLAAGLCGCAGAGGAPPGTLVTFRVTGGLAGVDDRLTVTERGEVRVARARPPRERGGRLHDQELATLRGRLEAAGLRGLPRRGVDGLVRDGFEYTVSYEGAMVSAADGAIPPGLAPVIQQLSEILRRELGVMSAAALVSAFLALRALATL